MEDIEVKFIQAIKFLKTRETCSISDLKQHFNIGDNYAGMLVDKLQEAEILAPFEGSKQRRVLITQAGGAKTLSKPDVSGNEVALPEIYLGQPFKLTGKQYLASSDNNGNNIQYSEILGNDR